jgi:hypothetical protein
MAIIKMSDLESGKQDVANWVIITNNYTAIKGDHLLIDTSTSTLTITLPSSPSIGDTIECIDVAGTHDVNNVTFDRNNSLIMGLNENLIADVKNARYILTYSNNNEGWKVN